MVSTSQASKVLIIVLTAFLVVGIWFYFYLDSMKQGYTTYAVLPSGERIAITIARTDEERSLGLGGRQSLREDEGMYFVFPQEDRYGFWMKGMLIPIDIIWIKKGEVVGVEENVPHEPGVPDRELKVYHPPEEVGTVLEMKAGSARRYTIEKGSRIKIQIIPNR